METKEKPGQCPKCGEMSFWHNLKLSPKNNEPYENYKCKCGYIEWVPKDVAKKHYNEMMGNPEPKAVANISNADMLILEAVQEVDKKIQEAIRYLKNIAPRELE